MNSLGRPSDSRLEWAIAAAAKRLGISSLVVSTDNAREAAVVKGLFVFGFKHLSDVGNFLCASEQYTPTQINGLEELKQAQALNPTSRM